jgi:apolipoprotein N-acyltransferase
VERAAVRETVVMEHDVPLRTVLTLGVRIGRWVELALVVVALGALLAGAVLSRRSDRRIGSDA